MFALLWISPDQMFLCYILLQLGPDSNAPARMVTLDPPVPRMWMSVCWTRAPRPTSATTESVATSREALSASAGPATPDPSATTSLTSVSPTHAWSVLFLVHLLLIFPTQSLHPPVFSMGAARTWWTTTAATVSLALTVSNNQQQSGNIFILGIILTLAQIAQVTIHKTRTAKQ